MSNILDDYIKRVEGTSAMPEEINHPDYYNRYSVEIVEMARRIWGNEAMKNAAEITAFIYRMRAGEKPGNSVEKDLKKEHWWLDYIKDNIDIVI